MRIRENQRVDSYSAFDKISESAWNIRMYDDIVETLLKRCAALVGKESLDLSKACVLDVGSGPGGMSVALIKRTPVSEIALLDLRGDALLRAAQRIRSIAPDIRISLYNADVHAIPVKDNVFDLVISRGSQRFWNVQYLAYEELRRVMKPNGIAYIGGGRGSQTFQKLRVECDDSWDPNHFCHDRQGKRRLPYHSLPDNAYRDLFEFWGVTYSIYSNEGDGRWFCWQKGDSI